MTINDNDFRQLVCFVREKFGINLEHKRQLIDARLSFDISRRGYSSFTMYLNKVITDPDGEECRHMMNRLSTNYTFFFRESDYVAQLCSVVLTDLLARGRKQIRIWSAACSSGQEAYSVAMVLEFQKNSAASRFDFEITGTDINTEILGEAAAGIYPEEELAHIPARYRHFICRKTGGGFEVSQNIKDKIRWKYENLIDSSTKPGEYDIIFCRNVMIYFTPQFRREMTVRLHSALLPGGYLFTGATESIDLERRYFHYIAPTFYQKPIRRSI